MSAQFGVNVAPGGVDYPVAGSGPWHRLVLGGPPVQTVRACGAYHRLGRKVLGIVTRQVTVEVGGGGAYETARRTLDLFGGSVDALQIWNEPDGGGEASDVASKAVYNAWLEAFRDACRHVGWRKPLVAAGLVSGQPSWLQGVDMEGYLLACLVPDQRVTARGPTQATMRPYEGEVVRIQTATGNEVTVTPNHPILTRQGWLAAGAIQAGSEVAQHAGVDAGTAGEDDVQVPTPIREVFRALQEVGLPTTFAGTRLDFHGDGMESDVQVVRADRLLRDALPQRDAQLRLVAALEMDGAFPPHRHVRPLGRALEADALRFATGARGQPARLEQRIQSRGLLTQLGGQRVEALAGLVAGKARQHHVVREATWVGVPLVTDGQPRRLEGGAESRGATVDFGGKQGDVLPRQITFVQVMHVERTRFAGHVFNLTTEDGWIVADGIVTHNCHPYDQRPFHGYPDWGWGDLPDLLDAYRPWLPPGTRYWLTECSRTTTDAAVQARYAAALVASVATRSDVEVCLWYCWRDWRMPGSGDLQPFGLVREDGTPKVTLAAWVEAISMVEQTPTWSEDKQRIEEQISLLVENQRRILQGHWDEARIYLDAVDPAMAGKWTNCPVNGCTDLGG